MTDTYQAMLSQKTIRLLFENFRSDLSRQQGSKSSKSHRELGMNKSTLWYQKQRLRETGSVRLYAKTRRCFE